MVSLNDVKICVGVSVSFLLWYFVFFSDLSSFWIRITIASFTLALYAAVFGNIDFMIRYRLDPYMLVKGVISGCLLYALFFFAYNIFRPLVEKGASEIYLFKADAPLELVAGSLIITSVCEEFFWRRYIQRTLVGGYNLAGLAACTLVYALIHLPTQNLPLIFAAFIAGLYWGLLYNYMGSFWMITLSHIVWAELIFVFLPLN